MSSVEINIYNNKSCSSVPMAKLTMDSSGKTWRLVGLNVNIPLRSGNFKSSGISGQTIDCYFNGKVYLQIQGLSLQKKGQFGRVYTVIEYSIRPGQTSHTCYGQVN